jgi:predicted oxidoreductase (fatty acid repression mutant protein)
MASAYKVSFLDAIKIRRSVLSLSKESPITDQRIVLLVNHAIKHAPSPFHVQSARAIVLFGDEHEKLWNIGFEASKKTVPPQVFEEKYAEKINGFKAGYGTVSISLPASFRSC